MAKRYSSIEMYLNRKIPAYCREFILNEMEIEDGTPEYKDEYKSHKRLMEWSLWRDGNIINCAYYMEVPKKTLNRFGLTDKEINEEFANEGYQNAYPY